MKRSYEHLLQSYLAAFPCVALIGVRQCGKTTLLQVLPEGWKHYDLERRADLQLISHDPDLFFRLNPRQVAIDEAQVFPDLFPALRVAIDEHRAERGRFVITGSSSPALLHSVSESLAGRIGVIEMAPFSWEEVTETVGRDSFLKRLEDSRAKPGDLIQGLTPRGSLALVHSFWFQGGYPEPWLNPEPPFHSHWTEQYLQSYLFRDVRRWYPGLNEMRFRRFLELLGGLSGRILNFAEVARALGISQPTARDYFEIAHGTSIWRNVPAYTRNTMKRAVKHPRGYLRDSGLLHNLLRIPDAVALLTHPQMGASWEGMVVEELLRQLQALGAGYQYAFYRTGGGAEVDLVLEGNFGRIGVEIKHASSFEPRELRGLKDFVAGQQARLGIVINNDVAPRLIEEKIVGIPFACL